jgi:L-fuconolactonase
LKRRDFLKAGAVTLAGALAKAAHAESSNAIPIIDTHIHLYDPTRPEGVPWPEKTDSVLYKAAYPDRYKALTKDLGIRGAIAIECSPWESDNDWLLEIAGKNPIIVGVIGDLVPGSLSFHRNLERLAANPLFLGLRYGNLWNRNLLVDMHKPGFIDDLKTLAQAKLVLDSANPDEKLISALVRVKEKVPDLTIVIDHLPNARVPDEVPRRKKYTRNLEKLGESPSVFAKLSEIPVRVNGNLVLDSAFYRENLDTLWHVFGENRVLFGSDWPNSDHLADYGQTFGLVCQYMAAKSREAQEKFFWRNSLTAYHWRHRSPDQPIA